MMSEAKNRSDFRVVLSFFSVWVLYAIAHTYLQASSAWQAYAGYLSTIADTGLVIVVLGYAFLLWRKADVAKTKLVFGLYFFTYVCIFISDAIYNIIFNVLHLTHTDLSQTTLSTYNIPYLLGLILLFACFANIVPSINFFKHKLNVPIIVLVASIAFNLALFVDWKSGSVFSLTKIYDLGDGIFELANFIMAIACFIVAKNKGVFYFGLGYVIIIAADFIMNIGMLSQHFGVGSLIETSWILGLFFVIFALAKMKKTEIYAVEPKTWVNENNSLSTTFSFWVFILCNLSVGLFLCITYLFSPALFF